MFQELIGDTYHKINKETGRQWIAGLQKTYQEKNLVKNVLYTEDRSDELKASTPAKLLQPKSHIIKNDNSGSYNENRPW